MKAVKVFDDLYLFTSSYPNLPLTFNQYLLLGAEPVLFHTGSSSQTSELVPMLKEILGDRTLSYVFISHFESDECGGLNVLINNFPDVKPICSQITARQLAGFGFTKEVIVKNPNDTLHSDDFSLKFISYPSEMHLWEGLLAFEEKRSLLFSSDLFIRMGNFEETILNSSWGIEIKGITSQQIPSPNALDELQKTLSGLPVRHIVPGHGPVLSV